MDICEICGEPIEDMQEQVTWHDETGYNVAHRSCKLSPPLR